MDCRQATAVLYRLCECIAATRQQLASSGAAPSAATMRSRIQLKK